MSKADLLTSLLLLCVAVLVGQAQSGAHFVTTDCPDALLARFPQRVAALTCGWLHVAERHGASSERAIRLFVARLAAADATDDAPILVLTGGPGNAATTDLGFWLGSPLRQRHDILIVDQRGAGFSRPPLNCPEFDDRSFSDPASTCRDRLRDEGIALEAYNSASIVRDIVDLLASLDLPQVNIYAHSYGTRIALALMRDHPALIRAAILDAAYPPEANALIESAYAAHLALERLFVACASNLQCQSAYPDLRGSFYATVDALNTDAAIHDGQASQFFISGDDFIALTLAALNDPTLRAILPALIQDFADGEIDPELISGILMQMSNQTAADSHSEGLFLNLRCAEDAARLKAQPPPDYRVPPQLNRPLITASETLLAHCAAWNSSMLPSQKISPIVSATPTLLLNGAFDPVTPPHWGAQTAASLSQSVHITLPNAGHWTIAEDPCAIVLASAFLADPFAPLDIACLDLAQTDFIVRQKS